MIGQDARVVGWFRRSVFQVVDLDKVEVSGKIIKSYTRFWGIILRAVLIVLAMYLFMFLGKI